MNLSRNCFAIILLFASLSPALGQRVEVHAPLKSNPTKVTNKTGHKLRLHVFYGHDTARLIAFHETDLANNATINLDKIAKASSNVQGGKYYLNIWRKGWGLVPIDQHWKKDVSVWGDSKLTGNKAQVRARNSGTPRSTIRVKNDTSKPMSVKIYNASDKVKLIPAAKYTVKPGKTLNKPFFSKSSYRISIDDESGRPVFSKVVLATQFVHIQRWKNRLRVATLNAKLMAFPLSAHQDYVEKGLTASYQQRINAVSGFGSQLNWSFNKSRLKGFDVIGLQEIWRHTPIGDGHYAKIRSRLETFGFSGANIVRGTGKGTEAGWHHGLVIASKFPIVKTDEIHFGVSAPWTADALVEKGALFAQIKVENRLIAVFNTHLQADEKGDQQATRVKQLKKLSGFIKKNSVGADAVIVLGDFNVPRGSSEQKSWLANGTSYGDWRSLKDHPPVTPLKKLDYILTSANLASSNGTGKIESKRLFASANGTPVLSVAPTKSNRTRHVTDHPLVYGEFILR